MKHEKCHDSIRLHPVLRHRVKSPVPNAEAIFPIQLNSLECNVEALDSKSPLSCCIKEKTQPAAKIQHDSATPVALFEPVKGSIECRGPKLELGVLP